MILTFITLIFLPLLQQLNFNLRNQYEILDMKSAIITSQKHYSIKELKKGITIGKYEIKIYKNTICNNNSLSKNKVCVQISVTKGFTFIEMLISLLITIIILTIIPHLFRLTDTYLSAAYEFDQLEYSFFNWTLIK